MITVRLERGNNQRILAFSVTGHSGYAHRGADIVCAGVSAVTQTTVLGLQQVLGIDCKGSQAAGEMHCALPADLDMALAEKADLLLSTMEQGLVALASAYADYVRILNSKEV